MSSDLQSDRHKLVSIGDNICLRPTYLAYLARTLHHRESSFETSSIRFSGIRFIGEDLSEIFFCLDGVSMTPDRALPDRVPTYLPNIWVGSQTILASLSFSPSSTLSLSHPHTRSSVLNGHGSDLTGK